MAKLTKEQEYRALLCEVRTLLMTQIAVWQSSNILRPLAVAFTPITNRITAAISEPKADAQDGEAA